MTLNAASTTREDTDLGFARQFYVDGRFDFDEFEHAVDVILAGGSIHDAAQLDLPTTAQQEVH